MLCKIKYSRHTKENLISNYQPEQESIPNENVDYKIELHLEDSNNDINGDESHGQFNRNFAMKVETNGVQDGNSMIDFYKRQVSKEMTNEV